MTSIFLRYTLLIMVVSFCGFVAAAQLANWYKINISWRYKICYAAEKSTLTGGLLAKIY